MSLMSKQAMIKTKAIPRTTQASSQLKTSPNFYFSPVCLVCCLHGSQVIVIIFFVQIFMEQKLRFGLVWGRLAKLKKILGPIMNFWGEFFMFSIMEFYGQHLEN